MSNLNLIFDFVKTSPKMFIIYFVTVFLMLPIEMYSLPKATSQFISSLYTSSFDIEKVYPMIIMLVIMLAISLVKTRLENEIIPSFVIFIRKWVYKTIIAKYQKKFESLPLGKIISVLSEYPNSARNIMVQVVRLYIPYMLSLLFLCGYFYHLNPILGMVQLLTIVACMILFFTDTMGCIHSAKKAHLNMINLYENIQDRLSNIVSIYVSQQEKDEIQEHGKLEDENKELYLANLNCGWYTSIKTHIFIIISFCTFSYVMLTLYKRGDIKMEQITQAFIAEIYYFLTILRRLQNWSFDMVNSAGNINAILDYIGTYEDLKDLKLDVVNDKKPNLVKAGKNGKDKILNISNLYFKYPNTKNLVIKNLSFSVYENEKIWFKGNSGCGKSTLMKILMSALPPTKGIVELGYDKMNIQTTPVSVLRKNISFVNQNNKLFNSSIIDNMKYGNKNVTNKDIEKFVKSLNITLFDKLEKGLYTSCGINGDNLSGGQKQVVLIIRCYFRPAQLILMDEPLSAIDENNIQEVLEIIKKTTDKKTLLIISHDSKIASIVTREINVCTK